MAIAIGELVTLDLPRWAQPRQALDELRHRLTIVPPVRSGMIDPDLAIQPFWQLGPQALRKRIQRRDHFGAIAKADGAPLAEPELDALSWIINEWHEQGAPTEGRLRFTWYALGCDLYSRARAGRLAAGTAS